MAKCRDEYSDLRLLSFPIFPLTDSQLPVVPINSTLTLHHIQKHCDAVFAIDSDALFNIHQNIYKGDFPGFCGYYEGMNLIAGRMINEVTSIFRCNDSLGLNVDSFLNEMIKSPKLKYLCSSKAPFYHKNGKILDEEKYDNNLLKLTRNVFDLKRNFVSNGDENDNGIFTNLSTLMIYRGFDNIDHNEIVKSIKDTEKRNAFVNGIVSTVIKSDALNNNSAMMITNSTLINRALTTIHSNFHAKYRGGRGITFFYLKEGMEQSDFDEALQTLTDIISDYNELESSQQE